MTPQSRPQRPGHATSRTGAPKPPPASAPGVDTSGVEARRLAAKALARISDDGAYANILLGPMLEKSKLDQRDRGFVTELVYGATRMRRACDWLVDRYVLNELDDTARAFLRLGAYQLVFLDTPPHAAVNATVEAAPKKLRGLINAVLRRVAEGARTFPDAGTALSYPDWIIDRLTDDLGSDDAIDALAAMNEAPEVTERADGYVQDRASQWVAEAVGGAPGERVLDVCAAPGGKATALAASGAHVIAADRRRSRVGLVSENVERLGLGDQVVPIVADGTRPPYRPDSFDRVLLDAPCSGLGSLRRRADARWRIRPEDIDVLVALQLELVDAATELVKPGGTFVYSVCTLTRAESETIDDHLARTRPDWTAIEAPEGPWRSVGRGALVLPQDAGTDGMFLLRLVRPEA